MNEHSECSPGIQHNCVFLQCIFGRKELMLLSQVLLFPMCIDADCDMIMTVL